MDLSRLFDGFVLLLSVLVLLTGLLTQIDSWRSEVYALHLRWEREQRQAGVDGISLEQRQTEQADFERLLTSQPSRMYWAYFILIVAAIAFVLIMAWDANDLEWISLHIALPLGATLGGILVFAWVLMKQAKDKLTYISQSLYGPPPPRVRVRDLPAPPLDKAPCAVSLP